MEHRFLLLYLVYWKGRPHTYTYTWDIICDIGNMNHKHNVIISTLSALTQFQRWYHVVAGRFPNRYSHKTLNFFEVINMAMFLCLLFCWLCTFPPFCKRRAWGQQICVEHWVSMSSTLGKMLRHLEEERRWGTTENRRGENEKRRGQRKRHRGGKEIATDIAQFDCQCLLAV